MMNIWPPVKQPVELNMQFEEDSIGSESGDDSDESEKGQAAPKDFFDLENFERVWTGVIMMRKDTM